MKSAVRVRDLTDGYARALREYFEQGGEGALLQAYQLGRDSLGEGLGVLEVAAIHQEALVSVLLQMLAPEESGRIAKRASELFAEALAPFEMTRLGFQEANTILSDLNQELEERVKRVLRDYNATRNELDERRRMEELKDEFISVVSHEIRTPLTAIHGSLGLIRAGVEGEIPAPVKHLVEVAHRNSQRLVRLVGDVLDLQKIESGRMPFDIGPLELGPFLQTAIEANEAYGRDLDVSFTIANAPPGIRVLADADRLMQVMTNLLSNAAKFSPPRALVQVSARGGVRGARITVTDHGPGIPNEFRSRVFEKFAQADSSTTRERGGTGLGLSISKAIVERMGGRIGFETAVGAGTTFYLDLPLADGSDKERGGQG